ncbi:MAG: type IV pilus assembly protein PilM [Acidobacteria bacterium]|nr:type IV pilus assembly protein PilM [Acidobacteriota bacterium]
MLKGLRRSDSGIGLEIGNGAVRIVQLRTGTDRPEVLQATMEPIPLSGDNEPASKQSLAALKEVVKRTGLRKKTAAVALEPAILTTRDIQIPRVPDEELFSVVEWEIRQLIDFNKETHNLDFIIHNRDDSSPSNKYQVMVVVSKKSDLMETVKLVENAGLRVGRLGVPADALCSLASIHPDVQQEMESAIVNIGFRDSSVTVIQNGKLRFTRQLDFSMNSLISGIAEQLAVSREESAATLQQISLAQSENESVEKKRLRALGSSLLESLTAELNKSFNFYASVSRGGSVSRVYLTGGISDINGIESFFLEHLGVITANFHPFKGLEVKGRLPRNASQFSVAIGMGLMPW